MKHIEFKTSKGDFIIIELDENLINNISRIEGLNLSGKINCLVEHVGFIENITEDQANDIIKFGHYCPHNYTYHKGYWDVETTTFKEHNTAIDSLNSLLKVNGVCFESTYPDYDQALKHYETDLYWEAQQKVWNKEKTYLFKKI